MKARLMLHFDINKTILMSDRAQAGSYQSYAQMVECEKVWASYARVDTTWLTLHQCLVAS